MSASYFNKNIDDSNMMLNLPAIIITNASINSPGLFDSFNKSVTPDAVSRSRKFSNITVASYPETPNVSPIIFITDSPEFVEFEYYSTKSKLENNRSKDIKIPLNNCLNQRFSISPKHLRFSDASMDPEAFQYDFTYSNELFHWIGFQEILNNRNQKIRHASFNLVQDSQFDSNNSDDDVFVNEPNNVDSKEVELHWANNYEFKKLRRKHSIDSCISLFRKHEIDMETFYYLSKNNNITLDWTKRDDVLEILYDLSKNN